MALTYKFDSKSLAFRGSGPLLIGRAKPVVWHEIRHQDLGAERCGELQRIERDPAWLARVEAQPRYMRMPSE